MKSSQLPHCCWLKFALLFVTRRARKDWWAKHRLECTRQGFASSHVWNDHNWLKFARTQAVSLCAKSNQTNIDQQRTALTREGGAVNPELLFLIDYSPPWYAYIMFVSDISKKIRNVCVLLHRRSKRTVEVGVPVFSQLKIVFSRIFVSLPIINEQLFSISISNSPPSPSHPFRGLHKSVRMEWWQWWSWGILRVGFKGESSSAGERSRIRLADNLRPGVSLWPTSQPYSTV